jgi:uncharacterized membrane protein (DUF441 family)
MEREYGTVVPSREASFRSLSNWVAIIIGIIVAYQAATLGRQGLWYDELFTVMATLPEL